MNTGSLNTMFRKFLLCGLLTLGWCSEQLPLVKTPLGQVRGYFRTSHDGRKFSAFEGIPFAKAPIGERRFEEPSAIEPWHGVWNATAPTKCVQTIMTQPNITEGDEDCLHINVYVPRTSPNPGEDLDVIVHIHGGAYLYGSGVSYNGPDMLMDREVIYVNFNYRLGILGFLSTEDDVVPGNNGLKDQTMALRWVQENIASFVGNPGSVTINGISAGGSSVHLHYFSDLSKGLFHRGFSQSGLALNPFSVQEGALSKAQKLADAVGCPTTSSRVLVDCLKQRPYKHLLDKISLFFTYLFIPCVPFGPVVEKGGPKPFLKADPYYLLTKGQVSDVPWIASMAIHEGFFPVVFFLNDLDNIDENWDDLAPYLMDFNYTLSPSQWTSTSRRIKEFYFGKNEQINKKNLLKFIQVFSDRYFLADAETAVRLQAKVNKSPVYFYSFGYPGDNNEQKIVSHGADAKYFSGNVIQPGPLTDNELKMKDLLVDMLVSFAKTGKPKLGEANWKPTGYDKLTYLSVNGFEPDEITQQTTEEFTSRKFWKSLGFLEGENLLSYKDEL